MVERTVKNVILSKDCDCPSLVWWCCSLDGHLSELCIHVWYHSPDPELWPTLYWPNRYESCGSLVKCGNSEAKNPEEKQEENREENQPVTESTVKEKHRGHSSSTNGRNGELTN